MRAVRALVVALALVLGGMLASCAAADGNAAGSSANPAAASSSQHGTGTDPASGLPLLAVADLPAQARATLALIDSGGPFPYSQDGSVFGNFEGNLPDQPRGYYTEYTVDTPGSVDRGARRIVAGSHHDYYYTDDHYASFGRINR